MEDLNIAEILSESGRVRYRYARYLSADGTEWIRHGRFEAYHVNGTLSSEGTFVDGVANQAVVDAIRASSASRSWTEVPG